MRRGMLSLMGTAVTLGAVIVGCGGDDSKSAVVSPAVYSQLNESCARTGDCRPDLVCISNRCVASTDASVTPSPGTGGSNGVGGSSTTTSTPAPEGGTGGVTTPIVPAEGGLGGSGGSPQSTTPALRLSAENQSCTRTSDCEANLVCIELTCVKGAQIPPEAGVDAPVTVLPAPKLGARGESCQVASDCATGLICVPREDDLPGSVCELSSYGLTPSGKVCGGECMTAADCCELPQFPTTAKYRSCSDVIADLGSTTQPSQCTAGTGSLPDACLYYVTYCNCAASTWACTSNQCVYKPTGTQCVAGTEADKWGGCPTKTRLGRPVWTGVCNAANMCAPEPVPAVCTTAAECDGKPVADEPTDACSAGECTCYQSNCYRKCAKDLDCPDTYKCNSSAANPANLCVPSSSGCTQHLECVKALGNAKAECRAGECVAVCANDYECAPSGANRNLGEVSQVCVSGRCQPLGCSSDLECWRGVEAGSPKVFCMTPPTVATTPVGRSAIVTGK